MEIDGKVVQFTSIRPILDIMDINGPGYPFPVEPLVNSLYRYDSGESSKYTKKFYNLQESKTGRTFDEVTDLKILGQPFAVTLLEFPNRGMWLWLTGRQDVKISGSEMTFQYPQALWVAEFGFAKWASQSEEELQQSYEEDVKVVIATLKGFFGMPHFFEVTFHYIVDLIKLAAHEQLEKSGYFKNS